MRLSAAVTELVRSEAGPGEVTQWVETACVEKVARLQAQAEVDDLREQVRALKIAVDELRERLQRVERTAAS